VLTKCNYKIKEHDDNFERVKEIIERENLKEEKKI